jgi:hypothetical protein
VRATASLARARVPNIATLSNRSDAKSNFRDDIPTWTPIIAG